MDSSEGMAVLFERFGHVLGQQAAFAGSDPGRRLVLDAIVQRFETVAALPDDSAETVLARSFRTGLRGESRRYAGILAPSIFEPLPDEVVAGARTGTAAGGGVWTPGQPEAVEVPGTGEIRALANCGCASSDGRHDICRAHGCGTPPDFGGTCFWDCMDSQGRHLVDTRQRRPDPPPA
ncbi:MAG: hypothetical protein R3F55_21180 [Alphaproteobacteria bacterium]